MLIFVCKRFNVLLDCQTFSTQIHSALIVNKQNELSINNTQASIVNVLVCLRTRNADTTEWIQYFFLSFFVFYSKSMYIACAHVQTHP